MFKKEKQEGGVKIIHFLSALDCKYTAFFNVDYYFLLTCHFFKGNLEKCMLFC